MMNKAQKKHLIMIIISALLFLCVFIPDKILENGLAGIIDSNFGFLLPLCLYLIIYIFIGHDLLKDAFYGIFHGQLLDENFLMAFSSLGAFTLGIIKGIRGEEIEGFDEGCAVVIFFEIGEWFEHFAVSKSRKSIADLMDIKPDKANLLRNNNIVCVSPEDVSIDDIIIVKPGERIPLDGIVVFGDSSLDTKALTGEAIPKDVFINDIVYSGAINLNKTIHVKATSTYSNSTVKRILDLVENASNRKAKSEGFITKFARIYTPAVVILALLVAIIPSLISGNWLIWIYRALNFLVVSCPCALVISVPLAFYSGIGCASKNYILIKGSNYLELLNKSNIFVFDKTGTITRGSFEIEKIEPKEKQKEILYLAAMAERDSNHPIALSIKKAYGIEIESNYNIENIPGEGIIAKASDDTILLGNELLLEKHKICYNKLDGIGSKIYVVHNNVFIGAILISDTIKPEAYDVISNLNKASKTIMLTGDNNEAALAVSNALSFKEYHANLLPNDKVGIIEDSLNNKNKKDVLCFIGDGINDAPTLMRSDIGISMGKLGSEAAIEASDVVLMRDNLKDIIIAKKIAKKTMRIVYSNIIFVIVVKVLIILLSALGLGNMWLSIFGDVGVAVIAILNAMTAININNKNMKEGV